MQSFSTITFHSSLLQSVAFVGGYAVHSYLQQSVKCDACMSLITQGKELEIVGTEDTYKLIQLIDRGDLKWPSHIVIDAIIIVLKIFITIENDETLMRRFLAGPSRPVFLNLFKLPHPFIFQNQLSHSLVNEISLIFYYKQYLCSFPAPPRIVARTPG